MAWLLPGPADACSIVCDVEESWRLELVSVEIVEAGGDTDADTDPPEWPSEGFVRAVGFAYFDEPDTGDGDSDIPESAVNWAPTEEAP